ncbi:MAG: hypothetical protein U9R01_02445 [candidate division WOR-3 bacterium]|nr:hypothetical protein [candidate division WOR-3 bacterium]
MKCNLPCEIEKTFFYFTGFTLRNVRSIPSGNYFIRATPWVSYFCRKLFNREATLLGPNKFIP